MFDNNPALTAFGRFPADRGAITAALAITREFIANARCGADAEAKLSIIVEELVANIIEHGGCPRGSEIDMDLAAIGADIGLTLTDSGMAFDPRLVVRDGDLPPERGGGAGIALVKSWATIVDYARHGDKNILTLVIPDHG
jgi:serine/threonine-protein kinase RsbW